ncbi:hypothetical protein JCM14076_20890 [Methylosoma difficile]
MPLGAFSNEEDRFFTISAKKMLITPLKKAGEEGFITIIICVIDVFPYLDGGKDGAWELAEILGWADDRKPIEIHCQMMGFQTSAHPTELNEL